MATYRIYAASLKTGVILDEIPLRDFRWTEPLGASGSWSGSLPLREKRAGLGDSASLSSVLLPNRTEVVITRDGVVLWSGILTGARVSNGMLNLDGPGLFSYFDSRLLRETRTYEGVDQLAIAKDIIDWAQGSGSLTYGPTAGPAEGSIGLTVVGATSGVTRDRTYDGFQRKKIERVVRQLTEVRDGFDFRLSWSRSGDTISRQVNFSYPSAGRDTALVFDFPGVIEDYDWSADGKRYANDVTIIGAGEGDEMKTGRAQNAAALADTPLWEAKHALKDLTEQTTLDDRASAYLDARKEAPEQVKARMRGGLGSWVVGDQVRLDIADAYVTANGRHRIVSQTVEVDANGGETITLDLLPSALTSQ